MKRVFVFLVLLPWCLCVSVFADATLRLPQYKKTRLANGLTVMLMEKHSVPMISVVVALRTGTAADPAGKEGLASLTNGLLRKGTTTRTSDQISEELDYLGGSLFTGESTDFQRISAEFMKKDIATGIALVADVIRNPTFPQAEVDKMQKQRVDRLRAAKDQAMAVIGPYFNAFLYGSHPYGRPVDGDERSVPAITRDDIVRFHHQEYVAENMMIAVAGDFSTPEMEKMVAAQFGGLPKAAAPAARVAEPATVTGRKLLLVDKPDSTQTFFRIGNLGISRTNPDRVAIEVVNTLFGGRFTSMINSALRIKSGLTYGASSFFDERRQKGPFIISSYTRNATTEKALDMALDVLKELHEKGPGEEQLASAKAYVKGQFPPRIETSDQLAGLLTTLELYGLDEREVNDYYARVDAVTVADARRIIQQYFPEENLVFTVIGKASEIAPLMKKYAPDVQTRSITAPGF